MTLGHLITHNRTAILGVTMLLVAAGLWAAATMPVAILPEVAFHRISLIARAGHLPVEQTLTAVTQPVENALTGILGVETIRSMTTRGGAQVDLLFGEDQDMQRALQLVQTAMEQIRPVLPAAGKPTARSRAGRRWARFHSKCSRVWRACCRMVASTMSNWTQIPRATMPRI